MSFEHIANDYGLMGKVAIVSGAGGPIGDGLEEGVTNGRATAILLARAGALGLAVPFNTAVVLAIRALEANAGPNHEK